MKKSIGANPTVFPAPVFIIGTYDKAGKPNVMNAAWGGISCSIPPCVSISLREATYTHGNIVNREAFTVSIPSEKHMKEADYFGIASGRNEDKFEVTGLTPIKSEKVDAPYIQEFAMILECKLVNITELGLHTHFTGEILDVIVEEELMKNGKPDIEQIKPFSYDHSTRSYYATGKYLGRAFSAGKELMK